jgi:hypothetical protein
MSPTDDALRLELAQVRAELADRRKALPAHSVRPWQLQEIEELEERERELLGLLSRSG